MSSVITIIFSDDKKKVLLIQRRDVPVWTLPGGGIEKNETPKEAAIRETLEETGLSTTIFKKVGEYSPINKLSRYTHLFICTPIKGEIALSSETKNIAYFDISNLPLMPPPYKEWIEDALLDSPILIQKKLSSVSYFNLFKNFLLHPILVIRFLLSKTIFKINS